MLGLDNDDDDDFYRPTLNETPSSARLCATVE